MNKDMTLKYIWTNHLSKNNGECALVEIETLNNNNNKTTQQPVTTSNLYIPCLPTIIFCVVRNLVYITLAVGII